MFPNIKIYYILIVTEVPLNMCHGQYESTHTISELRNILQRHNLDDQGSKNMAKFFDGVIRGGCYLRMFPRLQDYLCTKIDEQDSRCLNQNSLSFS